MLHRNHLILVIKGSYYRGDKNKKEQKPCFYFKVAKYEYNLKQNIKTSFTKRKYKALGFKEHKQVFPIAKSFNGVQRQRVEIEERIRDRNASSSPTLYKHFQIFWSQAFIYYTLLLGIPTCSQDFRYHLYVVSVHKYNRYFKTFHRTFAEWTWWMRERERGREGNGGRGRDECEETQSNRDCICIATHTQF